MSLLPVLSHIQVTPLLAAKSADATEADLSFDLGRTRRPIHLTESGIQLVEPAEYGIGTLIEWPLLEEIAASENSCFQLIFESAEAGQPVQIEKVQAYSEQLQRAYSLFPTRSAPTMLVSGITMHRIVDCDPWLDTQNKIKALGRRPIGPVLDTTMGLGYTASLAAETAASVLTVEIDPTVVEICRANPWSQALFESPKITREIGHAWDVIEPLPAHSFATIIHDPPMFNMAGELYSKDFYQECYRLLKAKGQLFHYIGNPKSRSGSSTTRGVIARLKEAGFRKVLPRPAAFGVLALK